MEQRSVGRRYEWSGRGGAIKADYEAGSPLFLWHAGAGNYRTLCEPWWFRIRKDFACDIGDFRWGQTLRAARAVLLDDGGLAISAREGRVKLAAGQVPPDVRKHVRSEAVRTGELILPVDPTLEWVSGKILNRSSSGFLVSGEDMIIHITGKTGKADGEHWSAQCKRDGLYEYTSVLGAKATVKNYVQP